MVYNAAYAEEASKDLSQILWYIREELLNPTAAHKMYGLVEEKLVLIKENPYIYPLHHDDKIAALGIRFVVIGNYLMFYTINPNQPEVTIVRILYEKRNIQAILTR